jgi:hypothetical protein
VPPKLPLHRGIGESRIDLRVELVHDLISGASGSRSGAVRKMIDLDGVRLLARTIAMSP